jgi:hypothetical protein
MTVRSARAYGPTLEALSKAGEAFGLGRLIRYKKVTGRTSFHTVFQCDFSAGRFALKRLVLRPALRRWRDRFESAFQIEKWLAERWSFLPKPVPAPEGSAIVEVLNHNQESPDWYIAHHWIEGHLVSKLATVNFYPELGQIISRTARVPLDLLKPRSDMDDPIPSMQEVIKNLFDLGAGVDVSPRQLRALEEVKPILESILGDRERSATRIIGHRDLSPQNVIANGVSFRAAVDWENAGESTLESEIGRVIACWTVGVPLANEILPLLDNAAESEHLDPKLWWFKSWLEGHLMFLNHLIATAGFVHSDNPRLRAEVDKLITFGSRVLNLLAAMRAASILSSGRRLVAVRGCLIFI